MHGRALPVATAVKLANRELTVIAAGGDGDGYAIGAGHFLHAVRRNPEHHVHRDGQPKHMSRLQRSVVAARRSQTWDTSPAPVRLGNPDAPINGLAVALAAGGTFLARGFSAQPKALVQMIKEAIQHEGFSLVEVMSPCVTFNKVNTYAWFKENVEDIALQPGYDPGNRQAAFAALTHEGKIPLGVIYRERRATFERTDALPARAADVRADLDGRAGSLEIMQAYR